MRFALGWTDFERFQSGKDPYLTPSAPRLFTALGPGDIVEALDKQLRHEGTIGEVSIPFSNQLVEFCRTREICMLGISTNRARKTISTSGIRLENRPRLFEKQTGFKYYLSQIAYAFYLFARAWAFRADLAIIDSGTCHYGALCVFALARIPVAINFHNALDPSPPSDKRSIAHRLIGKLNELFFRTVACGAVGVSDECCTQVRQFAGEEFPFFTYLCQFDATGFATVPPPRERNPFRILFVGRVEEEKGVFDLVEIATRLKAISSVPVTFEICGAGGAIREMEQRIRKVGAEKCFSLTGQLARSGVLEAYRRAHAVIVPSRIKEGFVMVCAEAILSHRPVITSRLTPALNLVREAAFEAEPCNVESYATAVKSLSENEALYNSLRRNCEALGAQFLDRDRSYPAAVDRLLSSVIRNWSVCSDYSKIFCRILRSSKGVEQLVLTGDRSHDTCIDKHANP